MQIIDIRPLQFPKLKGIVNFGSKLYFFFFILSCERGERKLLESIAKEKKLLFTLIINTKKIEIGVRLLLLQRRAYIRGLFVLKFLKKNKYDHGKFFYSGLFEVLERVLGFLKLWMSLSSCLWCFLSILGKKWVENLVLRSKKPSTCFSNNRGGQKLGNTCDMSPNYFFNKYHLPRMQRKKRTQSRGPE